MVSSIVPGSNGAAALSQDARQVRHAPSSTRRDDVQTADQVELSGVRDSVRDGLMQIHHALAIGHDAQSTLVKAQGLARSGGAQAQDQLAELLSAFAARLDAAIADGARLPAGEDIAVQAEAGASPVIVSGVDLRPGGAAFSIDAGAKADDPAFEAGVQRSLEALQDAMSRLLDSARALEAHQGFVNTAGAASVRHDLDADGARLLALQVRQGLEKTSAAAIANVEPQAVLSLFRA
ncbi:MAG: hypothetical protein JNM59_10060 [Hyphomonadaceae bacterium]|nr:hypothetical protein [Hyphomonadaceae bacterium]